MAVILKETREKVSPSVAGKTIPMPSFSQLRQTLKKADCLYYEPDYLNHAQEIIFQFLAENKVIFIREDSQIDFATGNVFSFNFSLRPLLPRIVPA